MIVYLFLSSFFVSSATECSFSPYHFLPPSLAFLISPSLHIAGLWSLWFQLWEEMNGWYLFLFPPSAVSVLYVTGRRGKQRLYSFSALGTWACNPRSMQGTGGKENTEAQTERCDVARLKRWARADRKCDTDGARRQTDRQTDSGRKDGQWCHMEKEGWVAAGRGITATGVMHFFLLFITVVVLALCAWTYFHNFEPYLQNSYYNKNFSLIFI